MPVNEKLISIDISKKWNNCCYLLSIVYVQMNRLKGAYLQNIKAGGGEWLNYTLFSA